MSNTLRGADVVARSLCRVGCRRVFTLSGNHIMSIFDAVLDAGIDLVHVRHEAAAVHMADAHGRLTGEAGVALVTGGPGHANAVGALYSLVRAHNMSYCKTLIDCAAPREMKSVPSRACRSVWSQSPRGKRRPEIGNR
jgi:glyoxylate carboligase